MRWLWLGLAVICFLGGLILSCIFDGIYGVIGIVPGLVFSGLTVRQDDKDNKKYNRFL